MKKTISWIVKGLIYASFFVPLVVLPTSFIFPFIVPKILLLRSLVILMGAGFVLLLATNWREYHQKWTPLSLALTAFLISFTLSTFIGVDPYHSFWDNHERMLGLFTIVHYVAYFFIASSVFKTWSDWKVAMRIFLIAGGVVMFIGLLQVANPYLLLNQGNPRVSSTLGNSIYVGAYGLFLLFVAYLLFIKEKSIVWRVVEVILGLLAILGMIYSGTRGSMLGAAVGLFFMLCAYSVTLKEYPRLRKVIPVCLIIGIVIVAVLQHYRQSSFVRNIPALDRSLNTSLADVEGSARWIAWQNAIEGWKDHPIFGWGPNNYFYVFNAHYNPKSLEFGYGETWFDNAHNIILNTLAVQGIVGLLAYLSIFTCAGVVLIQAYRKKRVDQHIMIVGIGFLIAHLVQNVTVFEDPTSYLYFMFWLAMVNCLAMAPLSGDKAAMKADRSIGKGLITGAVLVAALLIFIFDIQPARANMKTLLALQLLNNVPTDPSTMVAVNDALSFDSPHIDDIRNDLAQSGITVITNDYQKLGKDQTQQMFQLFYGELQKNALLHPLDIRVDLTLAQYGQVGAELYNNSEYAVEAEQDMQQALTLSPRRQQVIYLLANLKAELGDGASAIALLQQSIQDDPKISEGYWRLADLYAGLHQGNNARAILAQAAQNGVTFSDTEQGYITQILNSITSTASSKK